MFSASNRLGESTRVFPIGLAEFTQLHETMGNEWYRWVNRAPASWKRDGFLTSNVPVAITMRYGQNQVIGSVDEGLRATERRTWEADHNYIHLRQFTFSIATSYQ